MAVSPGVADLGVRRLKGGAGGGWGRGEKLLSCQASSVFQGKRGRREGVEEKRGAEEGRKEEEREVRRGERKEKEREEVHGKDKEGRVGEEGEIG